MPATSLTDDRAPGGRGARRRLRPSWAAAARYGLVVLLGAFFFLLGLSDQILPSGDLRDGAWVLLDVVVGLALIAVLPLRHRYPRTLLVLAGIAFTVSSLAFGAWALIVVSVSTRRRWADAVTAMGLTVVAALAENRLVPSSEPPLRGNDLVLAVGLVTALTLAFVATGWYVGARRDLVDTLRERAEAAEREQQLRIEQARARERQAIAREMHDVLAHRISLVAMHAGALTYRTDLTPEQVAQTASIIESNAHLALTDLRDVLGMLRESTPARPNRPQPLLADLPELLEETRAAGTPVTVDGPLAAASGLTDATQPTGAPVPRPPQALGRHAYRIVQEALTNARKHAPGSPVHVHLDGAPGRDLVLTVSNPLATAPTGDVRPPGAGMGLAGATERAHLAGGVLTHGVDPHDRFVVRATLPWPRQEETR